jgi:16S rRNA (guanine(966)-N(2))-methyltransferase RsmD
LFSILGADVVGARFLDLFAGTGAVGIEALSRGAAEVVFVEKSRAALRTIHENLAHTRLTEGALVEHADVFEYLRRSPTPYDYVYVAPPQYRGLWAETLHYLDQNPGWLYEGGWGIVQIHPREHKTMSLQTLAQFDHRTYGSVMLCFYR